jgi:hypothetical protein
MVQQLTLRPAQPEDFAFCERTYFEPMRATIEELAVILPHHRAAILDLDTLICCRTFGRPAIC